MAAIPVVTKTGPRTYTPVEPILGGQLVEARASGRVGVAAAGSLKVLGVAVTDATSPDLLVLTPVVDASGRPVLNAAPFPPLVPVAYGGDEVLVTYSAAAAFGDNLVSTANGQVAPSGATPDARTIVGRCTEPLGVASAAVGLMRTR